MKKGIAALLILGTMVFAACGPSAKDLERIKQDSIAKADSVAAVQAEIMAAQEKAKNDSIEAANAAENEKEKK